ncbi:MAG: transporter substrate-binding domain-containing protein [Salinimicrobium sp.]
MRKLILLTLLSMVTACSIPNDPEDSFEEAKKDALLVGAVPNPPYVEISNDQFTGSEIEKLRAFAKRENLRIKIEKGTESELVEKLEKYELHVMVGGIGKKTIWKKKAGLTAPYDTKHVFLIPKGENRLLKHLEDFIFRKKTGNENNS